MIETTTIGIYDKETGNEIDAVFAKDEDIESVRVEYEVAREDVVRDDGMIYMWVQKKLDIGMTLCYTIGK